MKPEGISVAVVDDEESVYRALARLLRAAGYQVRTYRSGIDFLKSLATRRPHCVVLDLQMPGVTGFDVQSQLTGAIRPLPVVMLTAHDSPRTRRRVLDCGAIAWLPKPVDARQLLAAVEAACAGNSKNP